MCLNGSSLVISHLEDALIQSDFQMKTTEAIFFFLLIFIVRIAVDF